MEVEFSTVLQEEGEGRVSYLWHWCAGDGERSQEGFHFFSECLRDARRHGVLEAAAEEPLDLASACAEDDCRAP